jgi:hypothetical protein
VRPIRALNTVIESVETSTLQDPLDNVEEVAFYEEGDEEFDAEYYSLENSL